MKKLLVLSSVILLYSFIAADDPLTKKERKFALNILKDTEKGVQKSIKGLTDEQLTYKSSDETWSVEGCVKHIAFSEQMLGDMVIKAMQSPANPEKRVNIKMSDEEIVKMVESRTQKFKTNKEMEPENIALSNTEDALASFKLHREKLLNYMETTQEDMRNHVMEMPFGTFDAYQMVLFIAAHTSRHTKQIEEVKAGEAFPKK